MHGNFFRGFRLMDLGLRVTKECVFNTTNYGNFINYSFGLESPKIKRKEKEKLNQRHLS